MFTIIHSVDNFYTAKLTKILKLSALHYIKILQKTTQRAQSQDFGEVFNIKCGQQC